MKVIPARSLIVSALMLGALALLVLPGAARAGDIGNPALPTDPIVREPAPDNPTPDKSVECGEVVIQPVPGPCDPADTPVGVEPPPTDPPVGINPPPEGRIEQLRLWIERRGQTRRIVAIDCGKGCPVARYLIRLSEIPSGKKCRARRGTVRAGGVWRGQRIGAFHNRNACAARVWRKAAPIYNRLVG